MRKQILRSVLIGAVGIGLSASGAMALSLPTGTDWSDADYWTSSQLDSDLQLQVRNNDTAGWFGIYFVDDIGNPGTVDELLLFKDTHSTFDTANLTWVWDASNAEWDVEIDIMGTSSHKDGVSLEFGFFQRYQVNNTYVETWYSDARLNNNNEEHIFIAYEGGGINNDNAYIFAAMNYDDVDPVSKTYVVDVSPVPEPTTMLLFGTGLIGLAGVARRRRVKK